MKFTKFPKGNTSYLSLKYGSWQDSDNFQLRSACVSGEKVVGPGVISKAPVCLCSWCLHWIVWPWARTARVLQRHSSVCSLCTEGCTERIREGEEWEHPGGLPGLCCSSPTSDTPSGPRYFVNWVVTKMYSGLRRGPNRWKECGRRICGHFPNLHKASLISHQVIARLPPLARDIPAVSCGSTLPNPGYSSPPASPLQVGFSFPLLILCNSVCLNPWKNDTVSALARPQGALLVAWV